MVPIVGIPIGMRQCYKMTNTTPAVFAAEIAFYKACVADCESQSEAMQKFWSGTQDP